MQVKGITLVYRSSMPGQIMDLDYLRKNRVCEINHGKTLFGPHRDDLVIKKEDRDLKIFGSEGEHRIASHALRLTEVALIEQERKDESIKLLDEAIAELDDRRQEFFLKNLQGQILFATTRYIDHFGKHFVITDGAIKETH